MSYTNRFPPTKNTRYRSSWGPSSVSVFQRADVPRPSPEEEEYADYYHERLHSAQSRQLIPLQEDLADWINKTISELSSLYPYFFLAVLYNLLSAGVVNSSFSAARKVNNCRNSYFKTQKLTVIPADMRTLIFTLIEYTNDSTQIEKPQEGVISMTLNDSISYLW